MTTPDVALAALLLLVICIALWRKEDMTHRRLEPTRKSLCLSCIHLDRDIECWKCGAEYERVRDRATGRLITLECSQYEKPVPVEVAV